MKTTPILIYIAAALSVLTIILTGMNGWWAALVLTPTALLAGYNLRGRVEGR